MSQAPDEEFLSQQGTILKQLANALIEATPEWWTEATLELEMGDEGCGHVISSAAHPADIVTPTDALFAQTFALQDLFEAKSKLFKKAVIRVFREDHDGQESWKFKVEYTY